MNKNLLIVTGLLTFTTSCIAQASPQSEAMFDLFDSDKNGEVTMAEYRNGGMDAEGGDWANGLSTVCTEHALKSVEPDLIKSFDLLDADNNKVISRSEFVQNGEKIYDEYWNASFKDADGDNNGNLSKAEFKKQATNYLETLNKSYAENKIPTECKADVEYWSSYYQGMSQYTDMAFGYLDQNSDNTLSYAEYKGTHLWK